MRVNSERYNMSMSLSLGAKDRVSLADPIWRGGRADA